MDVTSTAAKRRKNAAQAARPGFNGDEQAPKVRKKIHQRVLRAHFNAGLPARYQGSTALSVKTNPNPWNQRHKPSILC